MDPNGWADPEFPGQTNRRATPALIISLIGVAVIVWIVGRAGMLSEHEAGR